MPQIVVMPALGNTVESCLVTAWLVAVGDVVDPSTTLCEVETDKSAMDVPAGVSGTVLALLVEEGDDVPVKSPIAVVGEPGESAEAVLADAGLPPATSGEGGELDETTEDDLTPPNDGEVQGADDAAAPERIGGADDRSDADETPTVTGEGGELDASRPDRLTPSVQPGPAPASPRARGLAEREGLAPGAVRSGTGPHGRVIERDVRAVLDAGPRPTAGARGQDVAGVSAGTGLGGRVTTGDLAAAASGPASVDRAGVSGGAAQAAPAASSPRGEARDFPGAFTDTPLKGVRKLIAERMLNALATSAQLTYTTTADAAGMLALRKRFKGSDPGLGYAGITLGDLVCFATVQVLRRHANLNAHLADGALRTFESVHLGLAVDTPRGLLVPTIRNADALTLRELSSTTKELAEAARGGKIDPELLSGATFTVSNLGSFGIEGFTPIINVPQTGILGVNTIVPRAAVGADGQVVLQQRMGFSLTADHQVVDGADAGRFLADLVGAIENIDLTVMG